MKKEINPRETSRAAAFELWMSSPMPMVTLTKTFDVSRILKISRKRGWKFNMILCWAIGCAASRTKEFYLLPNHAPHLLPVSSCSDGWGRGCRISGVIASHRQVLAITPRLNLNSIGLTPCFRLNAVQKWLW